MSATPVDALNDPALSVPRRPRRSVGEIIRAKHEAHMERVKQADWLEDLFARANMVTADKQPTKKKRGASRG